MTRTMAFGKNDIAYEQDFRFWRGIPASVVFTFEDRGMYWRLSAPGYGGEPYGDGGLLVNKADVEALYQLG